MPRKKKETKLCISCGIEKNPEKDFYLSNSKFHKDGRFPVCKECLRQELDVNDIESVKNLLLQMNRPFLSHIWESSVVESEKMGRDVFGVYYKNIMFNFKDLTWNDSDQDKNIKTENLNLNLNKIDFEVTDEIINFWGTGYTNEQYKKLHNFKKEMEMSYEIETASHKDYLKKICIVSLKMEEALASDDIDDFKKLSDAYDKLMHSAKFTAVQRSAADRTGGMNTVSEIVEFAEKHGFIPKFHIDEPNDIVDKTEQNIMNYLKNLILGDPNIGSIVESALQKLSEKENSDEEDVNLEHEEYYEQEDDIS